MQGNLFISRYIYYLKAYNNSHFKNQSFEIEFLWDLDFTNSMSQSKEGKIRNGTTDVYFYKSWWVQWDKNSNPQKYFD